MFSSPRIFRLFGADVHVHSTFFIFAVVFYWLRVSGEPWDAALILIGYFLSAFGSVLVHELGHVLVARMHGIDCRRITLHGLGGLAHLDSAPKMPRDEFVIAFAGPVTSSIVAGGFWAAASATTGYSAEFMRTVAFINVMIAAFNMIPAYPLDGGQMLHACLRHFTSARTADIAASIVAQVLGLGLVAAGWHFGIANMLIIGGILFLISPSMLGRRAPWSMIRKPSEPRDGERPELRPRS